MYKRQLPIQIAYYAGLRIGEACGLAWQDVNLEEQCLTIRRSIQVNMANIGKIISARGPVIDIAFAKKGKIKTFPISIPEIGTLKL